MSGDDSQPEFSAFTSNADLQSLLVFSRELQSKPQARVDWMLTRHRTVFLAFALEQGIDHLVAAKLSIAQTNLEKEFADSVSSPIDDEAGVPHIKHPFVEIFNNLVSDIIEDVLLAGETKQIIDTGTRVKELLHGLGQFHQHP